MNGMEGSKIHLWAKSKKKKKEKSSFFQQTLKRRKNHFNIYSYINIKCAQKKNVSCLTQQWSKKKKTKFSEWNWDILDIICRMCLWHIFLLLLQIRTKKQTFKTKTTQIYAYFGCMHIFIYCCCYMENGTIKSSNSPICRKCS